jgi:plastocyanin domain-containing protein
MKTIILSLAVATLLIFSALMLAKNNNGGNSPASENNNVSVVNGTQIITISAKGGYAPNTTAAKAGIPTILKVSTNSTFDCSSALSIPAIDYHENLPMTGTTEIQIPPQRAGAEINGLCGMGMYNFSILFN